MLEVYLGFYYFELILLEKLYFNLSDSIHEVENYQKLKHLKKQEL